MNQFTKLFLNTLLILIIIPTTTFSQNIDQNDSAEEKLIIAAEEIMKEAGTCVLITLDKYSNPMVRIMDPFLPESDFTVWFGTTSKSRKVQQIKNNPTVTLYYQDSDDSGYVVIHGNAQIVNDKKEKEKRWKESWEDFYPNDREGYTLIKVSPKWMEILSTTRGILGDPITWKTPTVIFD
ncbi:MAG: pyridoxamine 5'-phosphate oxidase family protein [Flavobacteriaceae bacterium]|nr:pyridoxamine 5'-phosphate oxidase family protein [Bacteroidia bacterium]NNK82247.1 pyridoxamine 5'-phosphate oxidase family protein [Flavobacteriaceae bacterium]